MAVNPKTGASIGTITVQDATEREMPANGWKKLLDCHVSNASIVCGHKQYTLIDTGKTAGGHMPKTHAALADSLVRLYGLIQAKTAAERYIANNAAIGNESEKQKWEAVVHLLDELAARHDAD